MNTHHYNSTMLVVGCLVACFAFACPTMAADSRQENFDRDPVTGWDFSCEKEFVAEGTGRLLRVWGGGHALSVIERSDFALSFRYRSQPAGVGNFPRDGVGDILFRLSDNGGYSLRLEPKQMVLCWRSGNHSIGFHEQNLAAKPYPLKTGAWHSLQLRVQGNRIDVSVDAKPLISYTDPQTRPPGIVGLGVIAATGAVDYDDVVFSPPGALPIKPGPGESRPPFQQPPPLPERPDSPAGARPADEQNADLAVTDIYATRLRQGRIWIRITNHGPLPVSQQPLRLTTRVNGSPITKTMAVSLAPGQTEAYDTGRTVDTSQQAAQVSAMIEPLGLNDPRGANNTYSETVPKAEKPPTQPGPPPPPGPGSGPGSSERINLAVTNLRIDPQNILHVHLENRGGMLFTAKPCEFILVQNGHGLVVGPMPIPSLKPKERYFCNTGVKADWAGAKQLHVTATVRVPGWVDQQPQDNTFAKLFKP